MKPISVILLDDDRLVLDDLKSLIEWDSLGFSLTATTNSSQALQYIHKFNPQIFITDIIMPGIDGLTLIEMLQKTHPELKILIISSYDEFDYAKKAIKLGVCDYILKNEITATSFTEKLMSLSLTIRESSLIHSSFLTQELAQYFQTGAIPSPASKSFSSLMPEPFFFFITTFATPFCPNTQDTNQIALSSLKHLSSSLKQFEQFPVAFHFIHESFLFFAVRPEHMVGQQRPSCRSIAKQILQVFLANTDGPCVLFFYPKQLNIESFYAEYQAVLPLLYFHSAFYSTSPVDLQKLRGTELYLHQKQRFSFQILNSASQHLEEILFAVRQFLTKCYSQRDLQAITAFYHTFCAHMEILSSNPFHRTEPNYFPDLESLLSWISDTYAIALTEHQNGAARRYSLPVQSAIDFMQDQYSDYELTSEQIARHVALSPSRLNILFKKETNQTLNEYLTDLRIKEALYFLQNTNLKIYEISEKCGYKSSQYFSHVFSQRTGKRPLDYRKQSMSL